MSLKEDSLGVGANPGEVVACLPADLVRRLYFETEGRLIFEPDEARAFARLLDKYAGLADGKGDPPPTPPAAPGRRAWPSETEAQPAPVQEEDDPKRRDYTDGIVYPYQWMGDPE